MYDITSVLIFTFQHHDQTIMNFIDYIDQEEVLGECQMELQTLYYAVTNYICKNEITANENGVIPMPEFVIQVEGIVGEILKVPYCTFDQDELDYRIKANIIYAQIASCLNTTHGQVIKGFRLNNEIYRRFFQNTFCKAWLLQFSLGTLEEKQRKIKSDRKRNKKNSIENNEQSPKRGRPMTPSQRKKKKNLNLSQSKGRSRTSRDKKNKKKVTKKKKPVRHEEEDDSEEELSDS